MTENNRRTVQLASLIDRWQQEWHGEPLSTRPGLYYYIAQKLIEAGYRPQEVET